MNNILLSILSGLTWLDPALMGIFIIHTLAFAYLYYKKRKPLTIMLIVAFPFLATYYALKTFDVSFQGMSIIRWIGIVVATIPVILTIAKFIIKKTKKNRGQ